MRSGRVFFIGFVAAALSRTIATAEEPPPLALNPDGSAPAFVDDRNISDETLRATAPAPIEGGGLSPPRGAAENGSDRPTSIGGAPRPPADVLADGAGVAASDILRTPPPSALVPVSVGYTRRRAPQQGDDLAGANLRDADFGGAQLVDADLSYADLTGANLRDADLNGADLAGAIVDHADLRGADLSNARFAPSQLRRACYDLTTRFDPLLRKALPGRSGAACMLAEWRYQPIFQNE